MFNNVLRSRRHKLLALLLVCVFILSLTSTALAGTNPLNYVGTYLESNGAVVDNSTVPTNATFQIKFDKNVTNDSILANNIQCIVLKTTSGTVVPATVYRKGTGLPGDPERQNLYLDPNSSLVSGQSYQIIISPDLIAYNGLTLGYEKIVNFNVQ